MIKHISENNGKIKSELKEWDNGERDGGRYQRLDAYFGYYTTQSLAIVVSSQAFYYLGEPSERIDRKVYYRGKISKPEASKIRMDIKRYNKLMISIGKSSMVISVSSPEIGQGQERIPVEYKGEEVNFAFPPEFLIEFLQKVDDEKIIFAFTENTKPVLLRPESDSNFIYVSMPLKTE